MSTIYIPNAMIVIVSFYPELNIMLFMQFITFKKTLQIKENN
jgi:hypothetical protein